MLKLFRKPVGLIIFLVIWEAVSGLGVVSSDYMPRLATIGAALVDFLGSDQFWANFAATVQRMLLSLVGAVVIALGLAIVAGRYPLIKRTLEPITDILRSLPPPALFPLLIFVLGIGPGLFYCIIIYGCLWPTYISASNALATAEPVQVNTARSFGLSDWQIMWQVRLPAALPEAFTGIRLSAGISLLATVATEMLVGGDGLGALIFNAGFSLLWDDMYALMFIIGAQGVLLNTVLFAVRWPLTGWQMRYTATGAAT
ncbi:ABC transporter permease [Rhizobium sp. L1K21]|uniref:ABC transporter permease n=1 Tax=Rhizobium sp. L1K21 TaxID=2954933 RepID=UPI002091F7D2|nr:ABC transporter permease subunit [Rhizobium sp. L1K21]MCO6188407.1 ABC transporter permease subunit [Rhizobium sp. L1K21]